MMDFKIGECLSLFIIAIVFDVVGFVLLFLGIFGNLRVGGHFYGDFLIYTGSIVIFFSIAFWLMWYVGNIKVPDEDLGYDQSANSFSRLVRKLSEKLNPTLKGDPRAKFLKEAADNGEVGLPPRKASRVTWGKSSAYQNEGYDASLDSESPAEEKRPDTGLSDETSTTTTGNTEVL
ncbi:unnamed protein product [Lota lota]